MHFRNIVKITKQQPLSGLVQEIYPPLLLSHNEVVFDEAGIIVAWLFKDIISKQMMSNLESSADNCSLGQKIRDNRKYYNGAILNSLVERGGSGKIHPQNHIKPEGKKFL